MGRLAVAALLACTASLLPATQAFAAEDYPARPIKLVVGLAAGGASDALARLVGKELGARLKQPIVVENRPGAGGNIASETVAKTAPDGYTLLFTADNHNLNPLIYHSINYDPQKDFTGVILVSEYGLVLSANSNSKYKTMADLLSYAKQAPGSIFYGSSGIGLPNHIAMEKFNKAAGVNIVHVAYKGSSQSIIDAVSGQIPLVMSTITAAEPFIKSGKLTGVAITGSKRWPSLPQIPTMSELGFPAATNLSWMGIVAPAGTPKTIVDTLNREIQAVLKEPAIQDQFMKLGMGVGGGTADEFNAYLARDLENSRKVIRDLNIKLD